MKAIKRQAAVCMPGLEWKISIPNPTANAKSKTLTGFVEMGKSKMVPVYEKQRARLNAFSRWPMKT
jgi:hypothetical protein